LFVKYIMYYYAKTNTSISSTNVRTVWIRRVPKYAAGFNTRLVTEHEGM
jgi:hypothetical protein